MFYTINFQAGWLSFALGAISGAIIGLFFHRDHWIGGYDALPRRLLRLGHIAFFGLGFLNLLFVFSAQQLPHTVWLDWASCLLLTGLSTMSLVCFLSAWRQPFRHLFFIPAGSTLAGIACTVITTLGVTPS